MDTEELLLIFQQVCCCKFYDKRDFTYTNRTDIILIFTTDITYCYSDMFVINAMKYLHLYELNSFLQKIATFLQKHLITLSQKIERINFKSEFKFYLNRIYYINNS